MRILRIPILLACLAAQQASGATPTPTPTPPFIVGPVISLSMPREYHSIVIYDDNKAWITIDGQHPNVTTAWGLTQDTFPMAKTKITVTSEPIVTKTKDGWVISFNPKP
jgi:hypothetical protein